MATGQWEAHDLTFEKFFKGTGPNLHSNANLYMMFTSSSYTPNLATHDFEADLTNIVSGTNLSSAGVALTGATITLSGGVITFDLGDVNVATVTATGIRNLHIVDKTPASSAANFLIMSCTIDGDISPAAGALAATINALGVFAFDLHP
jgi:hypothetical protein